MTQFFFLMEWWRKPQYLEWNRTEMKLNILPSKIIIPFGTYVLFIDNILIIRQIFYDRPY